MRHNRDEVIERTIQEFELLDQLVNSLSDEEWEKPLLRPESKDPWTVKDGLAHIIFWKADLARSARKQRRPPEERGLEYNEYNHLIYMRYREITPQELLEWHRQVQRDVLAALQAAPEAWFNGKERKPDWPYDLEGHSTYHRVKDIERALQD